MLSRGLVIYRDEERVSRDEAEEILEGLRREHCHALAKARVPYIKGCCYKEKGKYVGEGSCLIYHFIEKKLGCVGCQSEEIVKQLNWIFENFPRFMDLRAEWKVRRVGTKRTTKTAT